MPESLEQLDLLLMQELRSRKVRQDGTHFEGLRHLSSTLPAYVGEAVTIRFDPRDMGEIRVFHHDRFLCRAIAADLAGNAVPLREILRARNRQRQQLRSVLLDRQQAVDTLLEFKRGPFLEEPHAKRVPSPPAPPSNNTATNSYPEFIETLEYRRFVEFCDACRRYRYIGLCFGTPGIGKILSAVRYSHAEKIAPADAFKYEMTNGLPPDTASYTPSIVNTPAILRLDIKRSCERANRIAREPIRLEAREALDKIRKRDEVARDIYQNTPCRGWQERPVLKPTYLEIMELSLKRLVVDRIQRIYLLAR